MPKFVVCVLLGLAASTAFGQIFDNFDSYNTGPLTTVSGGVWRTWENGPTDAPVVTGGLSTPNAVKMGAGSSSDVVTYSPTNVLGHLGAVAVFSFDFSVHKPDPNDIDSYFFAGPGDPATNDTFYNGGSFIFITDFGTTAGPNATSLHIWDGLQSGGPFGTVQLATNLALNSWHNARLVATQTVADMTANDPNAPDGTFSVFVDNVLATPTPLNFRLNDPQGLNAFEMYEIDGGQHPAQQYHLYDNVSLVPEPAALGLLALGLLLRRR